MQCQNTDKECKYNGKYILNGKHYCGFHYKKPLHDIVSLYSGVLTLHINGVCVTGNNIESTIKVVDESLKAPNYLKTADTVRLKPFLKPQQQQQQQQQQPQQPIKLPLASAIKDDQKTIECLICFDKIQHNVPHTTLECEHTYCDTCIAEYISHIDTTSDDDILGNNIICPECKVSAVKEQGIIDNYIIEYLHSSGMIPTNVFDRITSMNIVHILNDKLYNCIKCENKFFVDALNETEVDAFKVTCNICNTCQCANCGIEWPTNGNHDKVPCATYKKTYMYKELFMDKETKTMYDKEGIIMCPGGCGHALSIDSGCNVLKCTRDKIYVCALCGDKLDSSNFDVDASHAQANKHYWNKDSNCYQSLFVSKSDWLKTHIKNSKDVVS